MVGALALAGLGVAGLIGASAVSSYEAAQRAQTHFVSGRETMIPERRQCLNQFLSTLTKLDKQAIYNRVAECELVIQSLEGHAEMEKNGERPAR